MFLNPDAEIISGTSEALATAFARTGATLLGVTLTDGYGRPVASARSLPTTRDLVADLLRTRALVARVALRRERTASKQPRGNGGAAPGWIHGGAMAIKRADWDVLGGMDPGFFLWYEDIDLGARASRAGGTVAAAEDIVVRHTGGASWGRLSRLRRQVLRVRGTARYARKNLGPTALAAIAAAAPFALLIGLVLDVVHFSPRGLLRRTVNRSAGEGDARTSR
jgi:GT2 family glycosyltransferase